MAKEHILLVDDEKDILELLNYNLSQQGYKVTEVMTGEEALQKVRNHKPDLIVLDLMLPGIDGLDVCRILTTDKETNTIPIIMLTARGEEADIVTGLELGADDYITKPFSPRILLARIRAVIRKRKKNEEETDDSNILKRGIITINFSRREIFVNSQPIELTYTEFSILHFLAKRPGWVFTRNQIIDAVHGDEYPVTNRSVDVQIVSLRKKLLEAGKTIETVRGVGYRFKN